MQGSGTAFVAEELRVDLPLLDYSATLGIDFGVFVLQCSAVLRARLFSSAR